MNSDATQRQIVSRLLEALTPSAETKAAYIGEFMFRVVSHDQRGKDVSFNVLVPWTTIKEIMAAIRKRADLPSLSQETKSYG